MLFCNAKHDFMFLKSHAQIMDAFLKIQNSIFQKISIIQRNIFKKNIVKLHAIRLVLQRCKRVYKTFQ